MDLQKLKLKHFYRVHIHLDEYPTNEDILYELVSYLEGKSELDSDFSLTVFKRALNFKPSEDELNNIIDQLLIDGWLEMSPENKNKHFYKVRTHPWK